MRDEARERLYRVARPARGPAAVTREAPGRDPVELARSGSWTVLARAVLDDALAARGHQEAPDVGGGAGRLARDLAPAPLHDLPRPVPAAM